MDRPDAWHLLQMPEIGMLAQQLDCRNLNVVALGNQAPRLSQHQPEHPDRRRIRGNRQGDGCLGCFPDVAKQTRLADLVPGCRDKRILAERRDAGRNRELLEQSEKPVAAGSQNMTPAATDCPSCRLPNPLTRGSGMMHPAPSGASFDHGYDDVSAARPRSRLHVVAKFTVVNLCAASACFMHPADCQQPPWHDRPEPGHGQCPEWTVSDIGPSLFALPTPQWKDRTPKQIAGQGTRGHTSTFLVIMPDTSHKTRIPSLCAATKGVAVAFDINEAPNVKEKKTS